MSYNPISFKTIRQAMRWANIPTCALARESITKTPEGETLATYIATFDRNQVDNWYALYSRPTSMPSQISEFCGNIQDCFCDDIHVAWGANNPTEKTVTIALIISVPKPELVS